MYVNKGIVRKITSNDTLRLFFRQKTGWASLVILGFFGILALIGPYIIPYHPDVLDLSKRLLPPSSAHIFGTDGNGRDIYSRVIIATRIDLSLAFISVTIGYAIGVLTGLVSGYYGRITDTVIMRGMDIILAFPFILFAIALSISIGPGYYTIIIAVAVITVPTFARITRSTVLSTKQELYVTGAISIGADRWHILRHHILPNTISPTLVLYALNLGNAITVAAALSFLGAGIPPPTPEWGAIITGGLQYVVSGQWWISVFPGIFLTLSIMGFNMLGDTLREAMDVTLRR